MTYPSLKFEITEDSQVGEARRMVATMCEDLDLDKTEGGRAAIIVTELGRNLVRHGGGGELVVRKIRSERFCGIELLALDRGPGMANVATCLVDGYSTAGTPGTGLGAVKRLAHEFEIYSAPQRGAALWATLGTSTPGQALPGAFLHGGVSVPVKGETACGDAWGCLEDTQKFRLLVADGLGHGPFAATASLEAIRVFHALPTAPPAAFLERAHEALMKTRGAAASIAEIQLASNQILSAGIGNVCMRVIADHSSKSLVSENGTLGARIRKVQEFRAEWKPGAMFIMHSDGIATQWNLEDYPGLSVRHPSLIAGVLYRDFKRVRDDATVVVVRQVL